MSVDVPFPENKIPLQGFVFIQAIFQKMAWINTKERQSAMSEIFKKTYTVAEPGCGLTVFSMEGSEINLFGSRTVIKTSGEDFFEPIKDFLHEKLVEEKADTMYYISMVDTAVLGVLGGICIVVGVVGAFFTGGGTLPIAGVGCVLGGAAISSHSYTKTLDSDRSAGRDRSWSQFYLERTVKEFQGAAAGAVVFAGLLAGADLIAAAGGISSSIPSIVTAGTSGGTMAGALEAAGLEEAILGFGSMAVLLEAAMNAGKGGESKEGVGIEKKDSNADISDASKDIWSKGTFDSIEDSLKYHFNKHGQEVGAKDINQYVRKAKEFSKNLKRARVSYPKEGTPGAKTYTKNGKYITIDSDGKILTFGLER